MKPKNNSGIYYDTNKNRYIVSYKLKDNETGKNKRVRKSFTTKEDAEDFFKQMEYKKGDSLFIKFNSIPLAEIMRLLEERKLNMGRISPQQYGKNLKIIERIEQAGIGKKDINEITTQEIQNYFNSLTCYRKNYMEKFTVQFSQAFNYAHNKGYMRLNPMSDTYKPKSTKPTKIVRAMELEEQQKLTDYLKSKTIEEEPYKNAFLIQLYAGLRIGEALALQYDDIDLQNNLIHVNKTLTRDENEKVVMGNTTKTFSGIRDIPIQPIILEELKEQLSIAKHNFNNQLFVSSNGKYADPRNVNCILKRIMVNVCRVNDISTCI